jgi:alanine racemase
MLRAVARIDTDAIARNAARLKATAQTRLCVVVKADGYGHGALRAARAARAGGADWLAVATAEEARVLREDGAEGDLLVMGAISHEELPAALVAHAHVVAWRREFLDRVPDGVRVHVKLDTGMGRWGLLELPAPQREVVGVMSHLATADSDADFAHVQIERFRAATDAIAHLTRHVANSAAALRLPESRFDAARCGIALYGLSPFHTDATEDGLEPVLSWTTELALSKRLAAGESTGYGRRFVAERDTWVGIVPVGYADGFRRDLTGTEVRVAGEPRRVVGAVSMDATAVELDRDLPPGTPVTIVGRGVPLEQHARVAGTITYELTCHINAAPTRARRVVVDG